MNYPLYKLAVPQERFYYNYKEFVYTLVNNSIYITIDFPLTSLPTLQAFKVITFSVPAHSNNTNDVTELSSDYMNKCQCNFVTVCSETLALKHLNGTDCIVELYYNRNMTLIDEVCDFKYKRNGLVSQIIELSPTEILSM